MHKLLSYAGNPAIFYCPGIDNDIAYEASRAVALHAPQITQAGMKGYAGYGMMFSKGPHDVIGRDFWRKPMRYSPEEPMIVDQFERKHLGPAEAYTNCGTINTQFLVPRFPHGTLCVGFNDGSAAALPVRQALIMNGKRLMKDLIHPL